MEPARMIMIPANCTQTTPADSLTYSDGASPGTL